jgi:hypothetical protein
MKKVFTLLFLISVSWKLAAQEAIFIRVYDVDGRKIGKGKVLAVTDTSLQLKVRGTDTVDLSVANIGRIQTRRSAGHNVLIGSLIGAGLFSIVGAATADPDAWILGYTAAEGAALGASVGVIPGAVIGAISLLTKKLKDWVSAF